MELFTSKEILIADFPAFLNGGIVKLYSNGSFTTGQQLYIPTNPALNPTQSQLTILSGQSTIGTSPITVDPEAGGLTYAQITQQIQNQDYVITDLYIRTLDRNQN